MKELLHKLNERQTMSRMLHIAAAALLIAASATQLFGMQRADAAQLTARKVTISSSELGQTGVSYAFAFTVPTSAAIQGILFEFCTTPIGTCTAPGGTFTVASSTVASQTFSEPTAFADAGSADEGACTEATNTTNVFCAERADTDAETTAAKAITLDTVTNLTAEDTIYVRVATYSDTAFASVVDAGVVAAAMVNQITTTGRVQENLEFCVAAIDDDDSLPTDPTDCISNFNDTTVDLGVIDNTASAISPVEPTATNGSDDDYGIAQLSTNASSGASLTFFSETAGSGTNQLAGFRVTGATCNASDTNLVDQCFRPAANAGTNFDTSDGERFGIHVPCIDTTQGTTSALVGTADYDNADGNTASAANCQQLGTDAGDTFAWWDGATADEIASSTGPVHDEVVKIRFGGIASATTPTGSYTVTTTYIATPTF